MSACLFLCRFLYVRQSVGGCLPPWLSPPPPMGVHQMVPASLGVGLCLFHFNSAPTPAPTPVATKSSQTGAGK